MENLHEVLKLFFRARYSFALWVTGVLLLLAPLLPIPDHALYGETRPYIAAVTLFAFVVWLVEVVLLARDARRASKQEKARLDELDGLLQTLSTGERGLLAQALHRNQQTVVCVGNSHEVWTLVSKGLLLTPASGKSQYATGFVIPKEVWKLMQARKGEFPKPKK